MSRLHEKQQLKERLVVAIGFREEMKILGVPACHPKTSQATGSLIASITKDLLQQWK